MKGIVLDVYQFYLFNYEDWMKLFEEEKKKVMEKLTEKERENFNPYHFDYKQTRKLFENYNHVIICPDDTIWGCKCDKHSFVDYREGVYSFARAYFNKDLIS
jgi:hypothetical protein